MLGHPHLELAHGLRVRGLRLERDADLVLPTRATEKEDQLARHLQRRGRTEILFDPGEGEVNARDFMRVHAALRQGRWESQWAVGTPPPAPWPELAGKTIGILGYGRIGQCVARRARGFDMAVLGIRRNVGLSFEDDLQLLGDLSRLDEVLRRSDYLVVTLPLSPSTKGLIGSDQFRLMKPTAILINVSRAEVVDEDALYAALAERRLAGAALDVWYRYPTSPEPLWPARRAFHELPNVLMTPHVSGWTDGMLEARAQVIAENVRHIVRQEPPINLITSEEQPANLVNGPRG